MHQGKLLGLLGKLSSLLKRAIWEELPRSFVTSNVIVWGDVMDAQSCGSCLGTMNCTAKRIKEKSAPAPESWSLLNSGVFTCRLVVL